MVDHSTRRVSSDLLQEIKQQLKDLEGWGSVEIFVQGFKVTQITGRKIKKTNHDLRKE